MRPNHQPVKLSLLGICLIGFASIIGCASNPAFNLTSTAQPNQKPEEYMAFDAVQPVVTTPKIETVLADLVSPDGEKTGVQQIVRAQSFDGGYTVAQQGTTQQTGSQQNGFRSNSTGTSAGGQIQQAAFQYPETAPGGQIFNPTPSGGA